MGAAVTSERARHFQNGAFVASRGDRPGNLAAGQRFQQRGGAGQGLDRGQGFFKISFMQFFDFRDGFVARSPSDFFVDGPDQQVPAHADAAVQEGIRYFDVRAPERQPPGGDMLVIAVHESAVKIKQDSGRFGLLFLPARRNFLV